MYIIPNSQVKVFSNVTQEEFRGFVGYSAADNAVIVAVRGTDDIVNWIGSVNQTMDFMAYPKCNLCMVNARMYNTYLEMSALVKAQVQFILSKYRTAAIYVTGHSVGGALAALAALDIKATFGKVDQFYSYGQPRIGSKDFADYIETQMPVYRVICYYDMIPHIPPLGSDYFHGGS